MIMFLLIQSQEHAAPHIKTGAYGEACTQNVDCFYANAICSTQTCQCNYFAGYGYDSTTSSCHICQDNNQIIGDYGYCWDCPTNSKPVNNNCVCDEQNGFSGNSANCVSCWDSQQIIVSGACQTCPPNTKFVTGKCVCDESQGYVGADPAYCISCWGQQQIIANGACSACPSHTKFETDKCVCDQSLGYTGVYTSCSDCWGNQMVVTGSSCSACALGSVFKDNQCVCDEQNGFSGANSNNCVNCWSQSLIVDGQSCASCEDKDAYSTYDVENLCKCKPSYGLKGGLCKKITNQKTIIVSVCVPAIAILVAITAVFIILKKKKTLKAHIESLPQNNQNLNKTQNEQPAQKEPQQVSVQ
ncbi:Conserved_hypothetical protein [Hexamita inflata]|uniref:Uncharacterized protein n=1 Tax=Hexamita inflata TaxID=28002 RepID=A0AA86UTM3_9EUKA|nr:Conserved hypothetical protein [Hexamita inflata]